MGWYRFLSSSFLNFLNLHRPHRRKKVSRKYSNLFFQCVGFSPSWIWSDLARLSAEMQNIPWAHFINSEWPFLSPLQHQPTKSNKSQEKSWLLPHIHEITFSFPLLPTLRTNISFVVQILAFFLYFKGKKEFFSSSLNIRWRTFSTPGRPLIGYFASETHFDFPSPKESRRPSKEPTNERGSVTKSKLPQKNT